MSLSTVLFLFLAHLGVGIAFTLVFVSREAGVKFFRFNAGLSAILLVISLALAFNTMRMPTANPDALTRGGVGAVSVVMHGPLSLIFLVLSTSGVALYWATVGRLFTKIRSVILGAAVTAGVLAIVLQAIDVSNALPSLTGLAVTVASFLTSAAMLGGACTAMILGHWYLVIPSLEVSHLQSIVRLHIASMAARVVVVVVAVWVAIAAWNPDDLEPGFRHYIFSIDGIFFWQRVLFGLAGPAVLSYLTWETAKIRSTQSATGILYVDFFTVVVGEVLAKYIVLATRVPV
jgi:hypothetical protein